MTTAPTASLRAKARGARAGYTMTEMLVSMAVLAMILVLTTNMVSGTQKTLRSARSSAAQFRDARRAFEVLTRTLSQTTLNTYWDYDPPAPAIPTSYIRQSELHFVTGPASEVLNDSDIYGHCVFFNAPFGYAGSDATGKNRGSDQYRDLETLLNAWGYYVTYADDDDAPPFIQALQPDRISVKKGFRLMEFRQPSEELSIYKDKLRTVSNKTTAYNWFRADLKNHSRVVAENIIAMVIRPVVSEENAEEKGRDRWWIAPDYLYDSRGKQLNTMSGNAADASQNQVPPVLELTLVAVEEKSYLRYEQTGGDPKTQIGNLVNGLFDDPEEIQEDIEKLSEELDKLRISFRVFQASVGLRTAKWSD